MGAAYSRCRITEQPIEENYWPINNDYSYLCNPEINGTCPTGTYCGAPIEYNIPLSADNVSSTRFISYGIV